MCNAKIVDSYYTLGDEPTCISCKMKFERDARSAKDFSVFMRSGVYGLGAAIAGAIIYYAVLKLLNLEIGLVAIAIGFMVGHAMKKGAKGWGGRRYQLAAAGLTYFAVGMAYLPMAMEGAAKENNAVVADSTQTVADGDDDDASGDDSATVTLSGAPVSGDSGVAAIDLLLAANTPTTDSAAAPADSTAAAASDSTIAATQDSAAAAAASAGDDDTPGIVVVLIGFAAAFLFALALPVLVIIGSMPSGLISALIIGFGMQQAWKMTAGVDVNFQGPLRVVS